VDEGMTKTEVSQALDVSLNTVTNVCRSFQKQGLEAVERKKPEREYEHRLDGEAEAHLIAIACSEPPEGREHWTLRMLQREMVKRKYVVKVSHETVRTALKKRTQAMVEGDVLYSSESRCRFCVSDGRGFGCVQASLRSKTTPSLHGRDAQATPG
jgi:transposase